MFSKPSGANESGSSPWAVLRRLTSSPRSRRSAVVRCEETAAASSTGYAPADSFSAEGYAAPKEAPHTPPAQFEMFSREWNQMSQQDNWDGFRIEMATQVTKYLQASHTLFLGTQMRETGYIYQFGPAFQSEGQKTVMVARVGLDGGVNGRLIQKVGSGFELKASSQSHMKDPQRNMCDAAVEYTGKDWTCSAKGAWQGVWVGGASFTQRILPCLQLGGEMTAVAVNNLMLMGNVGVRWSEGKDTVSLSLNRQPDPRSPIGANAHEARIQYVRRLSERLALGTEYKFSHPDKESGLSMAYEYTFRNAHIQGLLDTDGKVSCCVFDLQGVGLSGMIDYFRGDYKFGVMMQVNPPDQQQPQ